MKRNIEIEDNLQDIINGLIEDITTILNDYLEDNPDTYDLPCLYNDLDYSGAVHEKIDCAVPVYDGNVADLFYLYGDEFERAFDDAGIGSKDDDCWPLGWKRAAIYCYLEEQVNEWYHSEAESVFQEWEDSKTDEEE